MKNNALFLLLTLLLLPSFAFSIGTYAAGDKLTVHAASGLILRETASPTGTKIQTVEYGSLLTVQAEGLKKTAHSVSVFPGFTIKGFWVKVKTGNGKTGFVFDGYLSKYKTPGSLPNDDDSDSGTIQERYLKMHSPRKAKVDLPKGETRYERYKVTYTNGAEVEADMGEGGSSYTIRFNPGVTIEEAYLIGKAMWMEDEENIKYTINKGVIYLDSGDEMTAMQVSVKAGIVHLVMQHAD